MPKIDGESEISAFFESLHNVCHRIGSVDNKRLRLDSKLLSFFSISFKTYEIIAAINMDMMEAHPYDVSIVVTL